MNKLTNFLKLHDDANEDSVFNAVKSLHDEADVVRASWEADGVDRRPLLGIEELDRPHSAGVRGSLFPRCAERDVRRDAGRLSLLGQGFEQRRGSKH